MPNNGDTNFIRSLVTLSSTRRLPELPPQGVRALSIPLYVCFDKDFTIGAIGRNGSIAKKTRYKLRHVTLFRRPARVSVLLCCRIVFSDVPYTD